jgi:hypothetical protein
MFYGKARLDRSRASGNTGSRLSRKHNYINYIQPQVRAVANRRLEQIGVGCFPSLDDDDPRIFAQMRKAAVQDTFTPAD